MDSKNGSRKGSYEVFERKWKEEGEECEDID